MKKKSFNLKSIEDTKKIAHSLAKLLIKGDIVTFTGDLGAGKTTFCKYLIQALMFDDIYVTSPTFNIVQLYPAKEFTIYHFDLYRLKHPHEIYDLAIDDAWRDGICLIEWPEIIENILPKKRIDIDLAFGKSDTERVCSINSFSGKKVTYEFKI
jgi:tRNA threonylcarbamoyl adenosine modification protein YjeE